MNAEQWRRVGELFHEALDRPPGQRTRFAEEASAGDPEVQRELLSLLDNDRAAAGFVEKQVKSAVMSLFDADTTQPRIQRVGAYRILRELGRGGMGTVFLAERDDAQYHTKVAIKLVRPGMDTDVILQRFRRERQTLAHLQHPHIARLLDGGTTDDGLPYIVMEYIPGAPITQYCSSRELGIPEILKLFLDVCSAVEYAHQHFVVHRDLKPGNIMVSDDGTAKLLDFGICKLLQHEHAMHDTASGTLRMLTPDYASPEQVRGDPVTIASDIYSLAAVLYELLTGFKPHRFEKLTPQAVERAVCDHDVIRPSLVPDKMLARRLRGDLDNILMLALQKDPDRRYASVEQFSEDIRRYLAHQPVRARPDTVTYRIRKFARRESKMLVAGGVVIGSLLAGALVYWHEARIAQTNLLEARRLANVFVFDVHDAVRDLPGSTRARQLIVETGLRFLDNEARNSARDWDLKRELATAYQRIGDVQGNVLGANLGNTQAALESYGKAAALLDAVIAHDPSDQKAEIDRLTVQQRIGAVYMYTQDAEHTLASYREAEKLAADLAGRKPGDERIAAKLAEVYQATGHALWEAGEFNQSIEENSKALTLALKLAETNPADRQIQQTMALAYSDIGIDQTRLGQLNEGLAQYRRALTILEELASKDPANNSYQQALMSTYSHLGDVLGNPKWRSLGDTGRALDAYQKMLTVAKRLHETDRANQRAVSDYAIALTRVAAVLPERQSAERVSMLQESLSLLREMQRVNPRNVLNRWDLSHGYLLLGDAYLEAGDRAASAHHYQESAALGEPLLAAGMTLPAVDLVWVHERLALLAAESGDRNTAMTEARRALAISGPDGPLAKGRPASVQRFLTPRGKSAIGLTLARLARAPGTTPLQGQQDRQAAAPWLQDSLEGWRSLQSDPAFAPPHREEMQRVEKALAETSKS
ncbi:MAG TPA: protein kinase [Bryobacteraceae bacterium]|nr:protein kinase [Bryobacteraceae bacterium]